MINLRILCLCAFLFFVNSTTLIAQTSTVSATGQKKPFKFNLKTASTTSAGVFQSDGTLVRTLWSGKKFAAGDHIRFWDGLDDNGVAVAEGNYTYKVLSNNVTAVWEGVIGNTTKGQRGFFDVVFNMAFSNGYGYMAAGYEEQQPVAYKFPLSDNTDLTPIGTKAATTQFVAADNLHVYWGASDGDRHWVYATNVSNDQPFLSTKAITVSVYNSPNCSGAIDVYHDQIGTANGNAFISGLAVQQTGTYLFVAHKGLNKLNVLDKLTGTLIQSLNVTTPGPLSIDSNDNLWMISNTNTVAKYSVNADGTLSAATLTLSGITNPVAISAKGTSVLVSDLNTQQVRSFNSNTGVAGQVLGTAGGYSTGPEVTNTKFYWKDKRYSFYGTFLAHEPDGSFWVGDGGQNNQHYGNCRYMHFAPDFTFKDKIMYIPAFYSCVVDKNSANRTFVNYLEFKVNYTQKAKDNWELTNNWGYNVILNKDDMLTRLRGLQTLSNGRTYAAVGGGNMDLVELAAGLGLRYTGVQFGINSQLYPDGNLYTMYEAQTGNASNWYKSTLTGFDASNNPKFSSAVIVETTPVITNQDPVFTGNLTTLTSGERTKSGVFVSFDGNTPGENDQWGNFKANDNSRFRSSGYHLGGVKNGKWLWKSAMITHPEYSGTYPTDGSYDIGNGVNQYSGSKALVLDDLIIWGHHGEFWKGGQTNMWNIVNEDGLFVNQFGTYAQGQPVDGMAGNSFTASVIKVGEDIFLYNNDESYHSGLHRWKITGLNTIETQNALAVTEDISDSSKAIDLMEGLPFNVVLGNNTNGWTRNPAVDDYSNPWGQFWKVKTSIKTVVKRKGRDVYAHFRNNTGTASVNRDLGNYTALKTWKLSGKINFDGNNGNNQEYGGCFFDVLDASNKLISRIGLYKSVNGSNYEYILKANGKDILKGLDYLVGGTTGQPQDIEIYAHDGIITITYASNPPIDVAGFELGCNIGSPKTMRLFFFSYASNYDRIIDVQDMIFVPQVTVQAPLKTLPTDHFRTQANGNWNEVNVWQSSADSTNWISSSLVPTTESKSINVIKNHKVVISGVTTVDQFKINDDATLEITSAGTIIVNDGIGEDVMILPTAKMIIKSDAMGTGRIGTSAGTIKGNVTVERFINGNKNASYRMLAPTVTSSTSIKTNWQEGVNNITTQSNLNPVPGYGTHITGSSNGSNGFDATSTAQASLFTYNWATENPVWLQINNTDTNKFDAKNGYLLFVRGTRSYDLNKSPNQSSATTLRATGSVLTGTVKFPSLLSDGKNSLVTNPYASSIDWIQMQANNKDQFENYYTMWDPAVGTKGGYVTIDVSGTPSVRGSVATTDIQSGQAFIIKSKKGTQSPTFVVIENDKTSRINTNVFRTTAAPAKLYTSLFFLDENGNRNLADGVLSRFNQNYNSEIDGDDAGDISNFDENVYLSRTKRELSIESRPINFSKDTIFLGITNMKKQSYEWQFNSSDFDSSSTTRAFLRDNYQSSQIPIEMNSSTVIVFAVTSDKASADPNRFSIVFEELKTLPVNILSLQAHAANGGTNVNWSTAQEVNLDKYEVEHSTNGLTFTKVATVKANNVANVVNKYSFFHAKPVSGNNYYRLRSMNKDASVQYSQIVTVKIDDQIALLSLFPNPLFTGNISVKLTNLQKGTYSLRLSNTAGQVVVKRTINHTGGTVVQTISSSQLAPGIYQIEVGGDNFKMVRQLVRI